jgi:hypothetical protein
MKLRSMRLRRSRLLGMTLSVVLAALVACAAPVEGQSGSATSTAKAGALEVVPGVDMSKLSPEQHATALQIMQDNPCGCGCGMNVYKCRRDDPNCGKSPVLAANVVRLVSEGKGKDEVVKAVFAAPAAKPAAAAANAKPPEVMVFPVTAGEAYFTGPEDAPVTLVTWLDYQ